MSTRPRPPSEDQRSVSFGDVSLEHTETLEWFALNSERTFHQRPSVLQSELCFTQATVSRHSESRKLWENGRLMKGTVARRKGECRNKRASIGRRTAQPRTKMEHTQLISSPFSLPTSYCTRDISLISVSILKSLVSHLFFLFFYPFFFSFIPAFSAFIFHKHSQSFHDENTLLESRFHLELSSDHGHATRYALVNQPKTLSKCQSSYFRDEEV